MEHEISVTIKPTLSCNMKCMHCFNGEKILDSRVLDVKDTCRFFELLAKNYHDIAVTFHGGEPTLVGYDYYSEIFAYQQWLSRKYGVDFKNNITSNGVLLDGAIASLLVKNNVLLNISFDGPYNNILRQQTELVYENIKKLQNMGAKIRIYCILSSKTYINLLDIYEWFKANGLDYKLIPIQPRGTAAEHQDLIMSPLKFVPELMKIYRYWLTDQECNVHCYTFEEFWGLTGESAFKTHWFYRKLALNPDGNIYPFGRPNDINFALGNSKSISNIDECFQSKKYKELLLILGDYQKDYCVNCESKGVCNGITVCSSFVYGKEERMLRYACELSNLIFQNVLAENVKMRRKMEKGLKVCNRYLIK